MGACELYARLAGGPEGECGAVWLHVIGYNTAAISLYERVGFQVQPSFIPLVCWPVLVVKLKEGCRGGGGLQKHKHLPAFYNIGGERFDAWLMLKALY